MFVQMGKCFSGKASLIIPRKVYSIVFPEKMSHIRNEVHNIIPKYRYFLLTDM